MLRSSSVSCLCCHFFLCNLLTHVLCVTVCTVCYTVECNVIDYCHNIICRNTHQFNWHSVRPEYLLKSRYTPVCLKNICFTCWQLTEDSFQAVPQCLNQIVWMICNSDTGPEPHKQLLIVSMLFIYQPHSPWQQFHHWLLVSIGVFAAERTLLEACITGHIFR